MILLKFSLSASFLRAFKKFCGIDVPDALIPQNDFLISEEPPNN
jgi:hypothetical protein